MEGTRRLGPHDCRQADKLTCRELQAPSLSRPHPSPSPQERHPSAEREGDFEIGREASLFAVDGIFVSVADQPSSLSVKSVERH